MALGDGETAVRFAKAAEQLEPTNGWILSNLAIAYLVSGDIRAAQQAIERALVVTPHEETVRAALHLVQKVAAGDKIVPVETILSLTLRPKGSGPLRKPERN